MIKVVSLDILDLVGFSSGVLFVLKENQNSETVKVSFYSFDLETKSIATVTKNAYLLTKFGSSFAPIAKQLGDYVSCDVAKLWNGDTFVIYSTGEIGIFDTQGNITKTGDLTYKGFPARDVAADKNYIWCAVTEQNLIIKYSVLQNRVIMRIGGDETETFSSPVSVAEYDGYLYVCNKDSGKIVRVNLETYNVEDYKVFDEAVYKYIKVDESEFVILDSGVYLL